MNNRKKRLLRTELKLNKTFKETINLTVNDQQFLIINSKTMSKFDMISMGNYMKSHLNTNIMMMRDDITFNSVEAQQLIERIKKITE